VRGDTDGAHFFHCCRRRRCHDCLVLLYRSAIAVVVVVVAVFVWFAFAQEQPHDSK